MRCEVSRDGGQTWGPLGVMRTAPGGVDRGQADRTANGTGALASGGLTVVLGTVPDGRDWLVTDISVYIATSSAAVSLTVDGVAVWNAVVVNTNPVVELGRALPILLPAGTVVALVFGAPGAGTPACYYNIGIIEQAP